MPGKMTEGQMDFLGLLSEYTDSQGATVRVREPGGHKPETSEPAKKSAEISHVKEPEPEQISLNFFEESIESIESLKASEEARKQATRERIDETERLRQESIRRIEAEFKKAEEAKKREAEEKEAKRKAEEEEAKRKAEAEKEAKRKVEEEEAKRKAEAEEAKRKAEEESKPQEEAVKEQLFKQCKRCWCFSCKHNSRNEGVPREMCGTKMACPACKGCIDEDMATICEIGNAKEGCMTRAIEEGIFVPEEV